MQQCYFEIKNSYACRYLYIIWLAVRGVILFILKKNPLFYQNHSLLNRRYIFILNYLCVYDCTFDMKYSKGGNKDLINE